MTNDKWQMASYLSGNSIIEHKTFVFATRILDLYRYLTKEKKEYIISKQVFRSGTSIGANVCEAEEGESRADFRHKLKIALKETSETIYWLRLLRHGEYINDKAYQSLYKDANEIRRILIAINKTLGDEPPQQ